MMNDFSHLLEPYDFWESDGYNISDKHKEIMNVVQNKKVMFADIDQTASVDDEDTE